MRAIRTFLLLTLLTLVFSACNTPCQDSEHRQSIEKLQVKLNATEAQLLNVRAELSKCKGDSIIKIDTIRP